MDRSMAPAPFRTRLSQLDNERFPRRLTEIGSRRAHVGSRLSKPQELFVTHLSQSCAHLGCVGRLIAGEAIRGPWSLAGVEQFEQPTRNLT
jgi:hypothetical protein